MQHFIDVYIKYVPNKVVTAVTPSHRNDFVLIIILYSTFIDFWLSFISMKYSMCDVLVSGK